MPEGVVTRDIKKVKIGITVERETVALPATALPVFLRTGPVPLRTTAPWPGFSSPSRILTATASSPKWSEAYLDRHSSSRTSAPAGFTASGLNARASQERVSFLSEAVSLLPKAGRAASLSADRVGSEMSQG